MQPAFHWFSRWMVKILRRWLIKKQEIFLTNPKLAKGKFYREKVLISPGPSGKKTTPPTSHSFTCAPCYSWQLAYLRELPYLIHPDKMGKSHRHKKLNRQEKAKTGLKGAKKLAKAANVVNPTLKVKRIVIREQLNSSASTSTSTPSGQQGGSGEAPVTRRHQTLPVSRTKHSYKVNCWVIVDYFILWLGTLICTSPPQHQFKEGCPSRATWTRDRSLQSQHDLSPAKPGQNPGTCRRSNLRSWGCRTPRKS